MQFESGHNAEADVCKRLKNRSLISVDTKIPLKQDTKTSRMNA
jgi:hypothetical protein